MSDEIIDITPEAVTNIPQEKQTENGLIIPDPNVVQSTDEETVRQIEQRRSEMADIIPEYPREWQQEVSEDTKGFDEDSPSVNVSFKEKEIKKIIKKYKRYMKSNLKEIRRIDN